MKPYWVNPLEFTRFLVATLGCSFICAGCIPVRMQVGKHIEGTIVEQGSSRPIPDVEVYYKGKPKTRVFANSEGKFVIERQSITRWLPPLPIDFFGAYSYPIVLRSEGYKQAVFRPNPYAKPQVIQVVLSKTHTAHSHSSGQ